MALRRALLSASFAFLALACGGGGEPADLASLQKTFNDGDYAAVEAAAPKVLAAAKTDGATSSQQWQIEFLHLRAVAAQGKGDAAAAKIETLAESYPDDVDVQAYLRVIDDVAGSSAVDDSVMQSITVLKAGQARYPEHDAFFAKKAESLHAKGGDGVSDALAQLGYLGSDGEDADG